MSALDRYHTLVRAALEAEGWTVTHDPMRLSLTGRAFLIDLAAERILGAERGSRRIAVEVKTFGGASPIAELQQAVGQFGMYEDVLALLEPGRELYLAVPDGALDSIFAEEIGRLMLSRRIPRVIGFSVEEKRIVKWIP